MKSIAMFGYQRPETGKSSSKNLRIEGKVPCVLYGGNEHVHFSMYEQDFKQLVYTPNTYKVKLDIEGSTHSAILKDIQYHPVNESIIHADFQEIDEDREVEVAIPIRIMGVSVGVRAGGKMNIKMKKLMVRCLPAKLPDFIEVNVENLEIGKAIKVADVQVADLELLDDPNSPVVNVQVTRAVVEEKTETAAPAAAPAATSAAAPASTGKK